MKWSDARRALLGAWLSVSLCLCGVLAAPFVLSPATLDRLTPVCERKARYNKECPLCGMTTAFRRISEGQIAGAFRAHPWSVPLWGALVLNTAAAAVFLVRSRSIILGLVRRRR